MAVSWRDEPRLVSIEGRQMLEETLYNDNDTEQCD